MSVKIQYSRFAKYGQLSLPLVLILLCCSMAMAQKNLLQNGGFENDFDGWNANQGKLTSWVLKSGKQSCALVSYKLGDWVAVDQQFKLPKNTSYLKVSGWAKTDNVVKGANDWETALIALELKNKSGEKATEDIRVMSAIGTSDWTYYEKYIQLPADAISGRVMLALGQASGSFFLDDIQVNAITETEFKDHSGN